MIAIWVWAASVWAAGPLSEWALPSGAAIVYRPDQRFPVVRVVTTIHAGTAQSPKGKTEVAHLAEHLAFRATVDGETADLALGAAGCWFNAETSLDLTVYLVECPRDAAEVALGFASALATGQLTEIDPAVVAVEANVVLAETTQRLDAGGLTAADLGRFIYPEGHPYHLPDQTPASVLALTLADVQGYFAANYRPDRAVIVLEGDLEPRDVARWVTRSAGAGFAHPRQARGDVQEWPAADVGWLGVADGTVPWFRDPDHPDHPLPAGRPVPAARRTAVPPPANWRGEPQHLVRSGGWPVVASAWYLPPVDALTWWTVVSAATLAKVDVGRALGTRESVLGYDCDALPGEQGSLLVCWVQLDDEEDREAVATKLTRAFDGPYTFDREQDEDRADEDEAVRWRRTVRDDTGGLDALADIARFRAMTGVFDVNARELLSVGGGLAVGAWRSTYPAWLGRERAVVLYIEPEGREGVEAGRAAATVTPDTSRTWPLPDLGLANGHRAERKVLPNGLEVVSVASPGIPIAAWRLAVPAPPASEDVARFLGDALHTPAQHQGNTLAYSWDTRTVPGGFLVGLNQRGTWDPRQLVRSLWGTVQARKTLDLEARLRRRVKAEVYDGRSPYTWRTRLWRQAVRANPERDGLPTLAAVVDAPETVDAYLRSLLRPERASLVVVGSLGVEASARITEEMGDWEAPDDSIFRPWEVERVPPNPEVLVLDDPRAGGTVSVRWSCPTGLTERVPAAVDDLLSALASARLYRAVRASTGLTYSPYAWTERLWGTADLHLQADTEVGLEGRVLRVLRDVTRDLGKEPPTEAELATARRAVFAATLQERASFLGLASDLAQERMDLRRRAEDGAAGTGLDTVATIDAATLTAYVRSCETLGMAILIGHADQIVPHLGDAGLGVRVVDWHAAHLALVEKWLPGRLRREQEFLEKLRE